MTDTHPMAKNFWHYKLGPRNKKVQ